MKTKSIAQIQYEGISALIKELGPVDTARFIGYSSPGLVIIPQRDEIWITKTWKNS
jgi:hypothetical protein